MSPPSDAVVAPAPGDAEFCSSGAAEDGNGASHRRRKLMLFLAFMGVAAYYGFAIAYYTSFGRKLSPDGTLVSWNAVDSIYFATVTMTTTGYGDLKPLDTANRYVTILLLLVGMLAIFPMIATFLGPYYSRLEHVLYTCTSALARRVLGSQIADGELVDLDGDGLTDYVSPPSALAYYAKGLSSWLILWITSQLLFAVGYMYIDGGIGLDREPLSFERAFYLCLVTATTVGYGDVNVGDHPARVPTPPSTSSSPSRRSRRSSRRCKGCTPSARSRCVARSCCSGSWTCR